MAQQQLDEMQTANHNEIITGICWLEDMAWPLVRQTYNYLTNKGALLYPPKGILILFYKIINLFQRHLDANNNIVVYDDNFVAYPLDFADAPTSFDPPLAP